jgi:hypothetical protein
MASGIISLWKFLSRCPMPPTESPSGTPTRQPLDGDKAGVGERSELGVPRHHHATVVLSGDDRGCLHRWPETT